MNPPSASPSPRPGRWTSLWVVALLSFVVQLWLCFFFAWTPSTPQGTNPAFGQSVPMTIDINPSNLWKFAYHFPPRATYEVFSWLGGPLPPPSLNPFSLAANLNPWLFFTFYAPLMATLALLAMAAFLRELELPRPAALFGAVIYAWQGDVIPFVFPAHFGYIATWPFYALAAWGALRALRTRHWAYAIMSGASCGLLVELEYDRGAIATLLIAALYVAAAWKQRAAWKVGLPLRVFFCVMALPFIFGLGLHNSPLFFLGLGGVLLGLMVSFWPLAPMRQLMLCVATAVIITFAAFLSLFQTNIVGVKLGGVENRAETYNYVTQFSIAPVETLTYLVPGFFGWHSHDMDGPYWGWIGQTPGWDAQHQQGMRNFNLAISTTGTVATVLGLMGILLVLPGSWLGPDTLTERQRFFGRLLLGVGAVGLVLAWGWHTPFYRALFALPLMDKWRDPLKWLELTNFALITLGALGLQHLMASLDSEAPGALTRRVYLKWFTGGMLGLLALGLVASVPYRAFALTFKLEAEAYEPAVIVAIKNTLNNSLMLALALMALFCCLLYGLWQPARLRRVEMVNPWLNRCWQGMLEPLRLPLTLALGLAALSVVQLGWVSSHFLMRGNYKAITDLGPLVEDLQQEGPAVRVSANADDPMLSMLLLNQFNAANISSIDVSAASRIPDDISAFFGTLDKTRERLYFLTGVKNLAIPQEVLPQLRADPDLVANIDPHNTRGYTLQPTASQNLPSHALVGLKDYLAKVTFVPTAEIIPDPATMLNRLKDAAWNPRASILLSSPAPASDVPATPISAQEVALNQAHLLDYTPTSIKAEVLSPEGGYVLVNDQFDPDWQAQVDGHPVPLLRADFIMRGVRVPAGFHFVTLTYKAQYHLGDILKNLTGMNVGAITLSSPGIHLFCDLFLIAAWVVSALALWFYPMSEPGTAPQQ